MSMNVEQGSDEEEVMINLSCRKVTTFQNYFNMYGLFHFMSPILINTMLSYFMNKNGFNLMTVTVIVAMSFQIGLVCFFGEVLSGFVSMELGEEDE